MGAIAGLTTQAADDLVSGHFSGADSYAAATFGGAAGGVVLGLTGNIGLAGGASGLVTEGSKSLLRGERVGVFMQKAALGAATGYLGGRLGSRISASGPGAIGRAMRQTGVGRAIARNEQMSNMMRGRLAAGQARNPSMRTVYKMTDAAVTSGAAAAKATGTVNGIGAGLISKSCGIGETCK